MLSWQEDWKNNSNSEFIPISVAAPTMQKWEAISSN